jgi:glyceraldehyde-3-phosphate dehydrogenase (NADP+)
MVSSAAADRVQAMIDAPQSPGAKLVPGPSARAQSSVRRSPTRPTRGVRERAFGPVGRAGRRRRDAAAKLANSSEFTRGALPRARDCVQVSRKLRVGSLWINDASRFRLDTYPFGGVGASGFGREGVRYAMEELSQWKFTGMRLTQ